MIGIPEGIAALLQIINKFVPNRRGRYEHELLSLEKKLDTALKANDTIAISTITKQLSLLRDQIRNIDE